MEKITERTGIYHEQQQGALCAQHAINNLLQSQVFLADSLADIARELDVEEKSVLTHTSHESENMDDTGFFNIQVIQRALRIFEIELVPFGSQEPIAQQARSKPDSIQAYICNLGSHWFTIRRFAEQYFNLNSIYYVPEFIPRPMLLHYLNLIKENGYSVFIVHGTLPACVADQQLRLNPITRQEYEFLTKDLPKLIMDGEVMGGPNDKIRNGNLVVQVSPDIYKELQKNPDNPRIREMIFSKLPKGVLEEDIPEHATGKNLQRRRQILIAPMPEPGTDEQLMGTCDCPHCRQYHQLVSEQSEEQFFDDINIDKPNKPQQRSQMITRQVTQTMISKPNSDDSNPSSVQRQTFTRTVIVMTQRRGNTSIDDHNFPQMTESNLQIENEDDFVLQQAMARSLLDESEMNDDARVSLLKQQTEELYQQLIDRVIAASLLTNDLEKNIEQTRNLMSATTTNSEPIAIKMPSSSSSLPPPSPPPPATTINPHSPPSTNIDSPSPTSTYSPSPNASLSVPPNTPLSPPTNVLLPSPTNTSIAPPINTSLPPSTITVSSLPAVVNSPSPTTNTSIAPPTNTSLPPSTTTVSSLPAVVNSPSPTRTNSTPASPMTTDLSPPTLTHSDSVQSPTVEELRQRRLQSNGNRHRSIISTQSDFDD